MFGLKEQFIDVSTYDPLTYEKSLRQAFAEIRAQRMADPWDRVYGEVYYKTPSIYSAAAPRRSVVEDEREEQYRRYLLNLIFAPRPWLS
jgi:hypothetical protein